MADETDGQEVEDTTAIYDAESEGDVEIGEGTEDAAAKEATDRAFAEQRRKLRAAEKRAAELEAKLTEKQRAEAEAEGRYKELYEEERAAREAAETAAAERERRDRITQLASDLGYQNPGLAHRLLDGEDTVDDTVAEAALKALAKQEPYLLKEQPVRTAAPTSNTAQTEDDPQLNAAQGLLDAIRQVRG